MKSFAQNMGDESDESPSPRRAWIEISTSCSVQNDMGSPSPRRAWIEMVLLSSLRNVAIVALPTEGVD